jgi:hypothetical protein
MSWNSLVVQWHAIDLDSVQLGVGSVGRSSVHTEVHDSIIPMISLSSPMKYEHEHENFGTTKSLFTLHM